MARGAEAKNTVAAKILATFDGSFSYDKEIRIPIMENGELLQIKCVLTCAKANVECGGDSAIPGESDFPAPITQAPTPVNTQAVAPTAEEKQNVANLLKSLGL